MKIPCPPGAGVFSTHTCWRSIQPCAYLTLHLHYCHLADGGRRQIVNPHLLEKYPAVRLFNTSSARIVSDGGRLRCNSLDSPYTKSANFTFGINLIVPILSYVPSPSIHYNGKVSLIVVDVCFVTFVIAKVIILAIATFQPFRTFPFRSINEVKKVDQGCGFFWYRFMLVVIVVVHAYHRTLNGRLICLGFGNIIIKKSPAHRGQGFFQPTLAEEVFSRAPI